MLLLPKWTQNVSKFILFHKWTAIFKLDVNFLFFSNFYISKMFCWYLKMWKIANLGYRNGRNSKAKHRIDKIFGTDAKNMCVYKTLSPDF